VRTKMRPRFRSSLSVRSSRLHARGQRSLGLRRYGLEIDRKQIGPADHEAIPRAQEVL
jgi:hypothetical protein